MHADTFDKVIEATSKLKSKPAKAQVAALTTRFLPALEKKSQENKGEVKKAFEKAHNIFSSMRDGIKNGDVGPKEFKDVIAELQGIRKGLAKLEASPKVSKKPSAEQAEASLALSDSGQGRNGVLEDRGRQAMQKYDKYKQLVPMRLVKKRYMAMKLPLVAVTDPLLFKERLASVGLCDDTIFGYPFIKNQTIIGIDKNWIQEEFKLQLKPAVELILDLLKDQTKVKYHQLGSGKARGNIMWIWVASDREMMILNRLAGGHFRVTGWDFPFEVNTPKGKAE